MDDKQKLLIIGAGAHSHVVIDILLQDNRYEIVGCLDRIFSEDGNLDVYGVPVIGTDARMQDIFDNGVRKIFIAIGNNELRNILFDTALQIGFEPVSIISRNAVVSPRAAVGRGSVVMPGAVVNAGALIGDNCIINTNSSVDHDCYISKSCHIAPGCALSGNVTVGEGVHIGTGTSIIDKIKIGEWSYIGAGSVVVGDMEKKILAFGVPARKVRQL